MARKITREEEGTEPVENNVEQPSEKKADNVAASAVPPASTAASAAPVAPVQPPVPAPKPVENKPIDVSVKLAGKVSVMCIRVVNGFVLYNDGFKNVRLPVKKGAPITVTLRQ